MTKEMNKMRKNIIFIRHVWSLLGQVDKDSESWPGQFHFRNITALWKACLQRAVWIMKHCDYKLSAKITTDFPLANLIAFEASLFI